MALEHVVFCTLTTLNTYGVFSSFAVPLLLSFWLISRKPGRMCWIYKMRLPRYKSVTNPHYLLGGAISPSWKMWVKVNGREYSIYEMEKNPNVWNHQAAIVRNPRWNIGFTKSCASTWRFRRFFGPHLVSDIPTMVQVRSWRARVGSGDPNKTHGLFGKAHGI